ncbi:dTDP-4-amino-4,6-dideoxygalactose transaminase [compost metagenome]
MGSSFLPGELIAAFLWAQLEEAEHITEERLSIWQRYHDLIQPLENQGLLRRPIIPADCQHNAHMYYVLLAPGIERRHVLSELKKNDINAVFHYVPLHTSPGGQRYGRTHGDLTVTERQSERLLRLPLWHGLTPQQQERIVQTLHKALA